MDKILVGVIIKPQGIKGELKVAPITDDVFRFKKLKKVFIDGKELKLLNVRISNGELFIYLESVNTRNDAENFRDKEIFIERSEVVLEKGRFLIDDLIGFEVIFENGEVLGKLSDVLQYAKVDTYVVSGNKEYMFPALDDVVISIDPQKKLITLNKKRFKEVAVHED